ncbi:MAG TPA: DUF4097 family beta strand repeat-containing protein [Polyangia bacterium]|jgi:DUF4097 and DUF4098 domain-containing protein YvlB|nr:DUF4097 family beta strand repeat-containing protein [Polyangia bacterium]
MRQIPLLTMFSLGLAFAGRASAHDRASVVTQDDFKVAAHSLITVNSDGGGVVLVTGPAGVVHVEADRKAGSEDEARKLDAGARLDGNKVVVHYKQAHDWGNNGRSVDFRITAPADAKIDVRTGGGQVDARGFSGGIHVDTGGGSILIADSRGELNLRTGGGSVDVRHVAGSVDIETGGGTIKVDGALSGKNRLETGGGSIHVCIPGDSRLNVDAETGGGSANNDFGLRTDEDRQSFRGRIGDGNAGSLDMRTGGGSIHLTRG